MVIPCICPPKVAVILLSFICEILIFYTIMQWKVRYALRIISKMNSKTCVKRPLSKGPKIAFQDQLSLNGQKYCSKGSILQYFRRSLSYHLSLRSLFVYFEWLFYTGFTVLVYCFIDNLELKMSMKFYTGVVLDCIDS